MSRLSSNWTMCVFKIVFSSRGQLTSCGCASSTALTSGLNSIFVYIEVQSCAIRVQSKESWCDSISRTEVRGVPYMWCFFFFFFDDGEKKDINDFFQCSMLGFHFVQGLGVRAGFVRPLEFPLG